MKAFLAENCYLDLDFFDWHGAELVQIEKGLATPRRTEPVPEKKEVLEPIAEEVVEEKKELNGEEHHEEDLSVDIDGLTVSEKDEEAPASKPISHYELVKRQKKKDKKAKIGRKH